VDTLPDVDVTPTPENRGETAGVARGFASRNFERYLQREEWVTEM
jgi:hypothetical protein